MVIAHDEPNDDVPFYKNPFVTNGVVVLKSILLSFGLLANLGVVLTVAFHNCPRKHAALSAASLCVSNIFYALFILFYATPLRYSIAFQQSVSQMRFYCHFSQVGSNAPKTWIVAHHLWIAIDTFWLIKRPFQYSTLIAKYFKAAFAFLWVGLTIFEIIFQTLTLCFYETFYHNVYNLSNPPTCIIPEIVNITISLCMYLSTFMLIVFLYYYVFKEALKRARGVKLSASGNATKEQPKMERESLTGGTVSGDNGQEAYKKELNLLYGFVALIMGTFFFIIARNFYYGLCLYIGCGNMPLNDYLVSTTTSVMISTTVLVAPYTYFYRNPLFWKCFLKFVLKVCPKLANYSEQLRQQANGYYHNTLTTNKTRLNNTRINKQATPVKIPAKCDLAERDDIEDNEKTNGQMEEKNCKLQVQIEHSENEIVEMNGNKESIA